MEERVEDGAAVRDGMRLAWNLIYDHASNKQGPARICSEEDGGVTEIAIK